MTTFPFLSWDAYPLKTETDIRHSDTDRLGHVNNVAFAAFLEFGRASMLHDLTRRVPIPGYAFVIVRLELDYRAELLWPGKVRIGVGVTRIGNSSFAVRQGVFDGETLAAEAAAVLVMMDQMTRKSAPMPSDVVAALEHLSLR